MGTLIIDEDPYSRKTARALLTSGGHGPVLEARNLREAQHFLDLEGSRLGLILGSWRPEQGMDLPLARMILARPALEPVPFVLMLQDRPALGLIRRTSRISRVDAQLYRPFGDKGLREAVREAHRHRAEMRSTLLLLGERFHSELASALLFSRSDHHWTDLRTVGSLPELREAMDRDSFRIGAILLDPTSWRETDRSWFRRFKRTPRGLGTQLACLSRDIREIGELRLFCDLFVSPPSEWSTAVLRSPAGGDPRLRAWDEILTRLSFRVIRNWEVRQDLARFRAFLRHGRLREARRCVDRAVKADPARWESQVACGDLLRELRGPRQAILHYQQAVKINPCSVRARLGLLEALPPERRASAAREALEFCPGHPEIRRTCGS